MGPSGGSRSCHAVDSHESRRRRRPIAGDVDFVFPKYLRHRATTTWSAMTIFDREFGYEYDLPQKKLYRLSVDDHAAEEIESVEGLFQAIFRGDAIREGDLFRVSHRQAAAADGDRTRPAMDPVRIGTGAAGRRPQTAGRDPAHLDGNSRESREDAARLVDHHSREVRSDAARLEDRHSRSDESRDRLRLSGRRPGGHLCPGGAARRARRRSHAAAGPGPNHKDCPAKPARFRQLSCHCRRKQRTQVWHRAPDSVQRRQVSCRRWHRRHPPRGVRG